MPRFEEPKKFEESGNVEGEDEVKTHLAKPVIKKKAHVFSDKYSKGKLIGQGPFGQVYTCWVKDGQVEVGGSDDPPSLEEGERKLLTLKILKKNLLS